MDSLTNNYNEILELLKVNDHSMSTVLTRNCILKVLSYIQALQNNVSNMSSHFRSTVKPTNDIKELFNSILSSLVTISTMSDSICYKIMEYKYMNIKKRKLD